MTTWDEIKQSVENNGDLLTFTMEVLREAHGAGRLGIVVRSEISKDIGGDGARPRSTGVAQLPA